MPTKKTAANFKFTRSFLAKKGHVDVTSFVAQPYCVGVYIATRDGGQLTQTWKGYEKWVKKVKAGMEKDGLTVVTTEALVSSFLGEDEINTYILSK